MPLWKVGRRDHDNQLKEERRHWQKDNFWTKSYHATSVANNVVNPHPNIFLCHYCTISHPGNHNQIWKKTYGFELNTKLCSSLPLRPGRNYAVVLGKNFMGNLSFSYYAMSSSVRGPRDIKSIKISTAYDIWFSRYRHSNLMFPAESLLLLVFIIFSVGSVCSLVHQ